MQQREAPSVLKALLQEISEDYLGVTLIRSGDSVIIYERSAEKTCSRIALFLRRQAGWNRVDTSHALQECSVWDFLCTRAPRRRMSAKDERKMGTVEFAK